MKSKLILPIFLLLTSFSFVNYQSKAANIAAGDLSFEWVGDSTYRIIARIYQDCASGSEPDSIPLCMYNSCTNSTASYYMQKVTIPNPWTPNCTSLQTTCDNPSSTVPGYEEVWYQKTLTLPSRCATWRASTYINDRNNSINISNATSSAFYLEATINNTNTHINSSAHHSVRPIIYATQNQQFSYNSGAVDPDGDSIVTQIIAPQTATACGGTVSNVSYNTASPAISVPSNPFQTNNQFSLNATSGEISFTSTALGKNSFAIRTTEYRNGTVIGSSTRELQVQTLSIPTRPEANITLGCGQSMPTTGNYIDVCYGQGLSFCFDIVSNSSDAKLYALFSTSFSGSFNTNGLYTDSLHTTYNLPPSTLQPGIYEMGLVILDTVCRPPGTLIPYLFKIPIRILGPTETIADTFICPNGNIQLNTTGGADFNWTILAGGTANSLSCTNCDSPWASPTNTTTYAVESSASTFCPDHQDTVTITVVQPSSVTYPAVSISVAPDSNIASGTSVTFTANATGCNNPTYRWVVNSTGLPGNNNSTFTSNTLNDNDIVYCVVSCADSCPSPRDTFSNTITMHINNAAYNIANNTDIKLYPNPNSGIFTIEINKLGANRKELQIEILNTIGQTVYSRSITPANNNIKEQINLNDMPSGMYLLKASTDSGTDIVRFIVADE